MNMNREHTIELLALLAVIAIVQLPGNEPPSAAPGETAITAPQSAHALAATTERPHRLDPVALLQASVPEHWRVELPPMESASRTTARSSMSC